MKLIFTLLFSACSFGFLYAQNDSIPLDKSPLDISYCPGNFTHQKVQSRLTEPLIARVIYSRPQKNGRIIFGGLLSYKEVWRIGANEATEIEFFRPVTFGKTKVLKGRYSVFCIPEENQWTIILNKELYTWGAFAYDTKKDVARVTVPLQSPVKPVEIFTIYFDKTAKGYNLNFVWDNAKASVPLL